MLSLRRAALLALAAATFVYAQTPVRHIQTETSRIATAVWAGDTLYVSGQLPNPVTPADAAKGTPAVYGDTKTQSISVFNKIEAILKEQDLGMKDVVMMHVYLAADPAKGNTLDFAGMNDAYAQFFGTAEQPNKPARAAMQVAALVAPGTLVEIEVIAVRSK